MKNKRSHHGPNESSEYRSWQSMKDRCLNHNHIAYKYYGGRGIKVCERWQSYHAFISDMGNKPNSKHTLERINGNDGYHPGNCIWATVIDQNRNKTNGITIDGVKKCAKEWCNQFGLKYTTYKYRVYKIGLDRQSAIVMPVRNYKNSRAFTRLSRKDSYDRRK